MLHHSNQSIIYFHIKCIHSLHIYNSCKFNILNKFQSRNVLLITSLGFNTDNLGQNTDSPTYRPDQLRGQCVTYVRTLWRMSLESKGWLCLALGHAICVVGHMNIMYIVYLVTVTHKIMYIVYLVTVTHKTMYIVYLVQEV